MLLADRVIVLGRNPARIRSDFEIDIPQYRDRKSPRFLAYVDYIYKILTRPEEEAPAPGKPVVAAGTGRPASAASSRCCRTLAPVALPDSWNC